MRVWIAFLGVLLVVSRVALADADHDRARRAVEEGRILPLKDILTRAQQSYPGQVIETELEEDDGVFVYELKIVTNDGRVMELIYDAKTGDLRKAKGLNRKR